MAFKLNANVDKKERKVATLKDFKGLDTVHSPLDIGYSHAVNMRNLISRNGANRKRYGWKQIHAFPNKRENLTGKVYLIRPVATWQGDIEFSNEYGSRTKKNLLVFVFESVSESYIEVYDSDTHALLLKKERVTLGNEYPLDIVAFENKIFIATGFDIYVISQKETSNELIAERLLDIIFSGNSVYIPLTFNLGSSLMTSTDTQDLSNRLFNKFVLKAASLCSTDTYFAPGDGGFPDGESTESTRLDGISPFLKIDENATLKRISDTKQVEQINLLSTEVRNKLIVNITDDDLKNLGAEIRNTNKIEASRMDQFPAYNCAYWDGITSPDKRAMYFYDRSVEYLGLKMTVYINGKEYKTVNGFTQMQAGDNAAFCPQTSDGGYDTEFNVCFCGKNFCADKIQLTKFINEKGYGASTIEFVFEFSVRNSGAYYYQRRAIEESKMLTLYGVNGDQSRLFFCDGGNTIYYSAYRNPFYIGAENSLSLGTTPITGWIKGTETSLYVFKEYSRQEDSLYVINGEFITSAENSYYLDDKQAVFRAFGYALPESALNRNCICNLANDLLFLSDSGVYALTLSANVASTERFARCRSGQISNLFPEFNLKTAKCIVFDNRMYIAMNDKVLIADARYRASFEGDMPDTFNYEYWLWDNMPVKYWTVINDKLYFMTDDNRLCGFYDGFEDSIEDTLKVAVIDDNDITISAEYKAYNRIKINGAYKLCVGGSFVRSIADGSVFLEQGVLYTELNENDTVYFDMEKGVVTGYPFTIGRAYKVKKIDVLSNEVWFADAETGADLAFTNTMNGLLAENKFRICKAADAVYSLTVTDAPSGNASVTDADGKAVRFVPYNKVTNYTATVYIAKPVVAVWDTGTYAFGTQMYAKTMETFTVAYDRYAPKAMKLYYTTANRGALNLMQELKENKDFSLTDLSFVLFTYNQRFETSYTRRFLLRNFNNISFRFESSDADDFSIEEISFVYKINRINRGEV